MKLVDEMKTKLPEGYIMLNIKPCRDLSEDYADNMVCQNATENSNYIWVTCVVNHMDVKENVYDKLNYRFVSKVWYDGVDHGFIHDKKYIVVGNGVPYEQRLFNKLNIQTCQLVYDEFLTHDAICEKEGKNFIL